MQSEFIYTRTYHGNVKALILDWSGTVADAYVIAPAVVFVDVFEKQGIEIPWRKLVDRWDCGKTSTSQP